MPGVSFQKMRPVAQVLIALWFVVSGVLGIYWFAARYLASISQTHLARSSVHLVMDSSPTLVFGLVFLGLGLYAVVKRVQQNRENYSASQSATNLEGQR